MQMTLTVAFTGVLCWNISSFIIFFRKYFVISNIFIIFAPDLELTLNF